LFYIIVFHYFIIVSCFHLSLASWLLLLSNKSSVKLISGFRADRREHKLSAGDGKNGRVNRTCHIKSIFSKFT